MDVVEIYLSALTHAYDPHSDYFAPEEAEDFNISAIDHAVTGIGAILRTDDGYATIEEVIKEDPKNPNDVRTISDFELATRLSYFLWSTMPDEELFALAAKGELRKPARKFSRRQAHPRVFPCPADDAHLWLDRHRNEQRWAQSSWRAQRVPARQGPIP